jgi:hypothetical protein
MAFGSCEIWRPLVSRANSEVGLKLMRGAPALCQSDAGGLGFTKTLKSSHLA